MRKQNYFCSPTRIETAVDCVLVIDHNPGLEDLTAQICGGGPEPMRQRMDEKFPTAALAAWVDEERLRIGPQSAPAEAEERHYAMLEQSAMAA